jgi:hypothetical protein
VLTIPGRRLWWALFVLLALAAGAWSVTAPLFAGPDEAAHAIRATAIVRGQLGDPILAPGSDVVLLVSVDVPEAYATVVHQTCFVAGPHDTPRCAPSFHGTSRRAEAAHGQQRAFPVYYAVVGVPTLVDPADTGMFGMRLVSALICAALLASALVSALTLANRSLAVVGALVALTPEVLFLTGVVNANSVEIAASVCLWCTALALARGTGEITGRLVARAGVATLILVPIRGMSPVYALLVFGVAWIVGDRDRIRALVRRTDARAWAGAGVVAFVLAGLWLVYAQSEYPLSRTPPSLVHAIGETPTFMRQYIGVFSWSATEGPLAWRDLNLPVIVYVIWFAAIIGLVVAACVTARRREWSTLLALTAAAVIMPITAESLQIPPIGVFWQGRHGLPLLCGVPILAGVLIDPAKLSVARVRRVVPLTIGALVAGQVIAFAWAVRRFGVGYGGTQNPLSYLFDPEWTPRFGPAALHLVVFAAAVTGVAFLLGRADRRARDGVQPAANTSLAAR